MMQPATAKRAQIIKPPKHIREKVGTTGGIETFEAVARARGTISGFSEGFAEESFGALDQLEAALSAALLTGHPQGHRDALFNASHEIRGQSGTFGYPLATAAADQLCKFILKREALKTGDLEYLQLYVKTIGAIFRQRLTDDGGALGAELKGLLAKMTVKV